MWPFSILQRRRHQRRLDVALFIHLGAYVFSTLRPDDRARVEAEVTEFLKQAWMSKAEHARYASPAFRAFCRALAMQGLDVPIPIEGLTWDSLLPRRRGGLNRQVFRFYDYRPRASATVEALALLRGHGLDVPDVLHDPYAEAHPPPRLL